MSAAFDLDYYRARIAALAARGIYVGTSSWNYPGWLGLVYSESRYETRGRFSNAKFERECLREYAETFKTVCFDGAYYTFYDEAKWRAMAEQVPADFKFALKVPEAITVKRWPAITERYRDRSGQLNPDFLNAELFAEKFLHPLEAIRANLGPIILEFSRFQPEEFSTVTDFLEQLDRFLAALPKGWPYSVELRNRTWLGPAYLACLKKYGVAHVFNNWTAMPAVGEQMQTVENQVVEDLTVARFLLKPGRKYEEAVQRFSPYKITQELNEEARTALAALIERGWVKLSKSGSYLYINNRLEGNALQTVNGVLDRLDELMKVPRPAPSAKPAPPPKPTQDQFDLGL